MNNKSEAFWEMLVWCTLTFCVVVLVVAFTRNIKDKCTVCCDENKIMERVCSYGNGDTCETMQKVYVNCMREKEKI